MTTNPIISVPSLNVFKLKEEEEEEEEEEEVLLTYFAHCRVRVAYEIRDCP